MIRGEITILEGSFREFTEDGGDILPWLVAWVSLITLKVSPSAAAVRSPRAGLNSTVGVGVRVIRVVVYLTVQNMAREAGLEINFKAEW